MPDRHLDGNGGKHTAAPTSSFAGGRINSLVLPPCLPGEGVAHWLAKAAGVRWPNAACGRSWF